MLPFKNRLDPACSGDKHTLTCMYTHSHSGTHTNTHIHTPSRKYTHSILPITWLQGPFTTVHCVCVCVCVRRLQGLWQSKDSEEETQPVATEEIRLTCTQFVRYHKDQCVQDLVHIRR